MIKNMLTALITLIVLISMIPIVFSFSQGFLVGELIVWIVLLVLGTITLFRIIGGADAWTAMFIFYVISAVNLFVIYTKTWDLSSLSLLFPAVILGLYISAFSIKRDDGDVEIEPYYEEK